MALIYCLVCQKKTKHKDDKSSLSNCLNCGYKEFRDDGWNMSDALKYARNYLGYGQRKQLAERLKISKHTLHNYEWRQGSWMQSKFKPLDTYITLSTFKQYATKPFLEYYNKLGKLIKSKQKNERHLNTQC